jgi:hypothetical protein
MATARTDSPSVRAAVALRLVHGAARLAPPPPGWFRRLRVRTTVWAQLYRWLRERHGVEGDDLELRERVVAGRALARRLRVAERARLGRRVPRGEVRPALVASEFEGGPQQMILGGLLAGEALLVLPRREAGAKEPWRRGAAHAS